MKTQPVALWIAIALLANASLSHLAYASDVNDTPLTQAAGTELFLSHDSDGFQTRKLSAEFFPKYENGDRYLGVRASAYQYKADDWTRDGQKISILARDIDSATANGWFLDTGVFQQNNHTLFTLDGSYRTALAEKTALEVFANRDWVETQTALDQGTHFTFAGAAMDQGLGQHVTLVGLAGSQFFSDDNRRDHGRLKLIYQPSLDLGLTLQARYRTYHSTQEDVGGAYFNPKNYEESMLALGWRKRFAQWSTGLTVGVGREKINDMPTQPTQLFELNVQSPVKGDQFLRMSAGYNNSASFNGPNYHYQYIKGEWVLRF